MVRPRDAEHPGGRGDRPRGASGEGVGVMGEQTRDQFRGTLFSSNVFVEEQPTLALRFVERSVPVVDGPRTVRILQQMWTIVRRDEAQTTSHAEWRDVPLEVE